jgi:hypothetical protein
VQGREAREVGREARSYRTASHRVIDRDNGDGSVRCRRNSGRERERGELPSCGTAEGSDPPEVGAVASRHWVGMTSGSCQAPVIEK